MTKNIIKSVLISGLLLTAHPAWANGPGKITAGPYVPPGNPGSADPRPCFYFQTNNGSQWYVVPRTDANYQLEFSLVSSAYWSGQSLNFTIGDPDINCAGHTAFDFYPGTAQ